MKHRIFEKKRLLLILGSVFLSAPLAQGETFIVNEGYRPIYLKFNGGNGVYGSEIGFNAILDTYATPNKFVKLGGTSQRGGANISVDSYGSMFFQMFDGGTTNEVQVDRAPQVTFRHSGNVGIGTSDPMRKLVVASETVTPANVIVSEFTRASGETFGSTILRVSRSIGSSEALDVEVNSGGAGPFRFGQHADVVFSTQHHYSYGPYGSMHFVTGGAPQLTIGGGSNAGKVGIGTTNPQNKLDVNGTIRAKEVIVESGWADHVFADGYALLPLAEVEAHIAAKRRLPGVPSAEEVADSGVSLGESQRILLEKVEELTLYLIEMRKDQQAREAELRAEIATLREELDRRSL